MKSLFAALGRYVAHDDPLTFALNKVAMVLAGNTPFYPLYLWAVLGRDAAPSILLTLCSFPFWAVVPAVARRNGLAGRLVLTVVGVLNTVWCSAVLGFSSGTALFLIPCVLLGTLGFHQRERIVSLAIAALPFIAYGVLRFGTWVPLKRYSGAEYSSLITLNGFSVACLVGFLGIAFASARPTRAT
ncbi:MULTISPECIES: hypothetical protein [Acidiphilium]|uniref:Uncharacterized protein n=1 Tax=Acidiphilium rubrum TaxID=526 RepID=A0A8G2CMX0_ACIRU|nr:MULTISPECIES: hypothetical protein [Acidiphilium]SIR32381.1 hypothetical protein SAMN05421828_12453 [Acidiphilium rubrum]